MRAGRFPRGDSHVHVDELVSYWVRMKLGFQGSSERMGNPLWAQEGLKELWQGARRGEGTGHSQSGRGLRRVATGLTWGPSENLPRFERAHRMHRPLASLPAALWVALGPVLALLTTACSEAPLEARGLVVLAGSTAGPSSPRPEFHDFGRVDAGSRPEHTFEMVNTDPDPVRILRITPSCSCSVANVALVNEDGTETPGDAGNPDQILTVPPGGRARFHLVVDTDRIENQNADKLVTVRLQSDSPNSAFLGFEAHVVSVRPLEFVPKLADFGLVSPTASKTIDVRVLRRTTMTDGTVLEEGPLEELLFPSGVLHADPPVVAELYPDPLEPGTAWTLLVTVPAGTPKGRFTGHVVLESGYGPEPGGKPGPDLRLVVKGEVKAPIAVQPDRFYLRADTGSVPFYRVGLLALDGRPFRIERTELIGGGREFVSFRTEAVRPDAEGRSKDWDAYLEAPEGIGEEGFGGTVRFHLTGAPVDTLDVPYVAIVP